MSKTFSFGVVALPLIFSLFSLPAMAQGTTPADPAQQPPPAQQPAQPVPQPGQPTSGQGAGVPSTMTVVPSPPPPPKEPYVLEDGGFYLEPFYWLNTAQPRLRGGLQATNVGDLQYNGKAKRGLGVEIGVPAGRSNTIRISAFQIQGFSNVTLPKDALLFGEQYTAGESLNANYKLQAIKASWDYLSYTWHKSKTAIHVKTLWEAQYVSTTFNATDEINQATGSKNVILPTFGLAIGSEFGKFFRWDVRGSGFGFPQHAVIGDVSATIAVHVSKIELLAGERLFYFKTSPRSDMYANDTLQGVYGGLRFVWQGKL